MGKCYKLKPPQVDQLKIQLKCVDIVRIVTIHFSNFQLLIANHSVAGHQFSDPPKQVMISDLIHDWSKQQLAHFPLADVQSACCSHDPQN